MPEFLAGKIIDARKISVESGQKKYKTYFVSLARLYSAYKQETDAILTLENCADCIVTA